MSDRSKNTINHLTDVLIREKIDIVVVTETWLKDDETGHAWLNSQCLHDLHYKHDNIPRAGGKKGGGLLLIY